MRPTAPKSHRKACKKRKEGLAQAKSPGNASSANDLFEKLWKLYPNKKGKGRISDAKKRALLKIGEAQMTRAIQRYITEHDAKLRNGEFSPCWQHGSTFFNSGYVDYLDENYSAAPREPSRPSNPPSAFYSYERSNTDWNDVFYKAELLQEQKSLKKWMRFGNVLTTSTSAYCYSYRR